jgi:hypothetical protein
MTGSGLEAGKGTAATKEPSSKQQHEQRQYQFLATIVAAK